MTIIKRTCANCAAFNSPTVGIEPSCWNLVLITVRHGTPQALIRDPERGDSCGHHLTREESEDQTAAVDAHRDVISMLANHSAQSDMALSAGST